MRRNARELDGGMVLQTRASVWCCFGSSDRKAAVLLETSTLAKGVIFDHGLAYPMHVVGDDAITRHVARPR